MGDVRMIKFPFFQSQELNLDWIMVKLKEILKFMPLNGNVGDVLQRNTDGAAWMPIASVTMDIHSMSSIPDVDAADELPVYDVSQQGNYKVTVADLLDSAAAPVQSVNGKTGAVVLTASDVGALPDDYSSPVVSVNGKTGVVALTASDVGAKPASYNAPVASVNGHTGAVVLDADDVGAMPDTYTAPVTSVNGQTGDVVIQAGGGGMEASLLWTNSAPTTTFAPQTVSIDLSDCKFVLIEYSMDYGFVTSTVMFPVPTITPSAGYSAYNVYMGLHWVGSQFTMFQRRCTITATGIAFESGTEFTAYNTASTSSTNNDLGIPKRIWGIK